MIDYEMLLQIKRYHEQRGLTETQIARELNLDARTIRKWLEEEKFRQRSASTRSGKLDPFKDTIIRMLELHPYTAAQIFQKIGEEGFDGG
jgi:orotate phosphoribosyltransferase-like protein